MDFVEYIFGVLLLETPQSLLMCHAPQSQVVSWSEITKAHQKPLLLAEAYTDASSMP